METLLLKNSQHRIQQSVSDLLYSKGLQTLLNLKWDGNSSFEENTSEDSEEQSSQEKKEEKNVIKQFIINCLRECLSEPLEENKNPNVLFMVEAQNSRNVLPCLNNNQLLLPNVKLI